jgi:hypothetical protein
MENNKPTIESQNQIQKSNKYIIQLERYTNDLIQSTVLINNYIYEPKTKELFELKVVLKAKVENLILSTAQLLGEVKVKSSTQNNQIAAITAHIEALETVHQEIKAYCCEAQNGTTIEVL